MKSVRAQQLRALNGAREKSSDSIKAALAKLGPDSNVKIAAEIGSRSATQVNIYKFRFLKANPNRLKENFHPPSQSPSPDVAVPRPSSRPTSRKPARAGSKASDAQSFP